MNDEDKLSRRTALKIMGLGVGGGVLAEVGRRMAKFLGSPSEGVHQQQKDEHIVATAEAADAGWDELIRNGFPEKSVESAVNLYIMDSGNESNVLMGSGSVIRFELEGSKYWAILTVKHVLEGVPPDKLQLRWVRPGKIPHGGSGVVASVGVGVMGEGKVGLAVLVCGQSASPLMGKFFGERVFNLEDLAFEEYSPQEKKIYGVDFSYPAMNVGKAHVVVRERVLMKTSGSEVFVDNSGLWHIERTQLEGGGSGMGVVDGDSKLIGAIESTYGYTRGGETDFSYYPGFVPLPLTGRENFMQMVRMGVDDLKRKEGL